MPRESATRGRQVCGRAQVIRRGFFGCLGLVAALLFAGSAAGAAPGPAWEVSSVAQPTNFSVEDNAKCQNMSKPLCDQYLVTVTNVGGAPVSGDSNRP